VPKNILRKDKKKPIFSAANCHKKIGFNEQAGIIVQVQ